MDNIIKFDNYLSTLYIFSRQNFGGGALVTPSGMDILPGVQF